jgi:hypothetical protein
MSGDSVGKGLNVGAAGCSEHVVVNFILIPGGSVHPGFGALSAGLIYILERKKESCLGEYGRNLDLLC